MLQRSFCERRAVQVDILEPDLGTQSPVASVSMPLISVQLGGSILNGHFFERMCCTNRHPSLCFWDDFHARE